MEENNIFQSGLDNFSQALKRQNKKVFKIVNNNNIKSMNKNKNKERD